MLDKNNPYFAESYSGSSAIFRDFFANQEDAVKAAEAELNDPNVSMIAVQFREFDGGGYLGDRLLKLDCFPNLSRLQEGVAHGSLVIPCSLDLNLDHVLVRAEAEILFDFGVMGKIKETLKPAAGAVSLIQLLSRASEIVERFQRARLDEYVDSPLLAPDEPRTIGPVDMPNVLVELTVAGSTVEVRFQYSPSTT